jgi:hypothetical protein
MTDKPQADPRMPPGYGKAAPPTPPRDPILGYPIMVYFIPGPPAGQTTAEDAPLFNTAPPATPEVAPVSKTAKKK